MSSRRKKKKVTEYLTLLVHQFVKHAQLKWKLLENACFKMNVKFRR